METLISIIIPLFNKGKTIGATIDSILLQGIDDFEIIVVDDGSTDNGVEIVRSYTDGRVRLLLKENGGPSSARNFGLLKSAGQWVMFLDADDTLVDGTLLKLEDVIHNTNYGIIAGNFYRQKDGVITSKYKIKKEGPLKHPFLSYLLRQVYLRPGSFIIRKEIAIRHSFNEIHRRNEDLEYALNLIESESVFCVAFPIMVYNKDESFFSNLCEDFNQDYLAHLDIKKKSFFHRLYIHRLYRRGISAYGDQLKSLYQTKEYDNIGYRISLFFIKSYLKLRALFD